MANTTWNPSDRLATALTNANLTATGTVPGTANYGAVRSVGLQTTGKYYWEYTPSVLNEVSTGFGIANATVSLPTGTSLYANGCALRFNGHVWLNGVDSGIITGGNISTGGSARSCFALDMTNKLLWVRGGAATQWNNGGTANPVTGVGGLDISAITSTGICAAFFSASTDACTANFGDTAFSGAVPSGFTSGFPAGGGAAAAQARVMVMA